LPCRRRTAWGARRNIGLTADLHGMTGKAIEVEMLGDTLKGEKQQESEHKEKNRTLSERSYGSFRHSFYLPDGVVRDRIEAAFANGVLTVSLPKTPAAAGEPKKIEVKQAA
jgi:HSP20 family protein